MDKIYNDMILNFSEGKYCIIPSFFRMMIQLKKIKREFAVVFRSFQQKDLAPIITEFNYFCSGQHPCFNGKNGLPFARFDGSKGTRKYHIDKKNLGYLVRESEKIIDTNMV